MLLQFRQIELSDKELVERYTQNEFLNWEYTFAMVWSWNVFGNTKICEIEGFALFVYTEFFGKAVFFPPYVLKDSDIETAMRAICRFCRANGLELLVNGIPKKHAELLDSSHFSVKLDENNFDYIYAAEDLKHLVGKKFHAKRNYVTRFEKSYPYTLSDYTPEDYDAIMQLYEKWKGDQSQETLDLEGKAIIRALNAYQELQLKIAVLKVEDKLVAFSVTSIKGNVAHTMFEKADLDYVGSYQAINKLTANRYFNEAVAYVNRQEDMGIEGLRKVKESYNPIILVEKFQVRCGRM